MYPGLSKNYKCTDDFNADVNENVFKLPMQSMCLKFSYILCYICIQGYEPDDVKPKKKKKQSGRSSKDASKSKKAASSDDDSNKAESEVRFFTFC